MNEVYPRIMNKNFIPFFIPFAVVGIYSAVSGQTGIRRAVIGSAIWVATMYAMPSVFPVTPGLMLHVFPLAIQLADVGGVPLVNFIQQPRALADDPAGPKPPRQNAPSLPFQPILRWFRVIHSQRFP
jgi:hypothetical protein